MASSTQLEEGDLLTLYDKLTSHSIPFVLRLITNLLLSKQDENHPESDPLALLVQDWPQLKSLIPKIKFINPHFTFQYE